MTMKGAMMLPDNGFADSQDDDALRVGDCGDVSQALDAGRGDQRGSVR
ncbi:Uncharacterised protein [Mycobacteroides abscessus subsp. abscessus]|nr:Uncharacterised protein [Mycobacteroides abscessus subsp. abscessus]